MAADEPLEQLKYQTLVFKVPIHCQGCKKSVHKALRSIDGVYKTTIDSDLHKVTVTGNVKPDTLLKKLHKTGKHAELWPEPKPNNNPNNKKNKPAAQPKKPPATEDDNPENISTGEANTLCNTKKTQKPNDSPASTPEKADSTAGSSGGKKSKGKKESNDGEVVSEVKKEAPAAVMNTGRPQGYNFPMYPLPTLPAYMMSYSTAHPSYGAAGYLPVQQSNYVYSTEPYMGSYYVPPAAPVDDGAEDGGDICGIM